MSLEPAHTIIRKFGGVAEVARITGAHRTRVSNWQRPKNSGGTGGLIPMKHVPILLAEAKKRELDLKADDFIPGASQERAA